MSAGEVRVRPARAEDLPGIAAIAADVVEDGWSSAQLAEELGRPIARFLVAEVDGGLGGFAITWHVAGEVSLLLIAVARGQQRRGVGRRLLDALEDAARREAMEVVLLEVRRSNVAAREFYQRAGYVEAGVRRGYYGAGGEDAILMQRALT